MPVLYGQCITGFVEYSSFTEAQDAGMTCAWNPSGTCLASGSQDGTVTIWDPRAHRVGTPHRLSSLQLLLDDSALTPVRGTCLCYPESLEGNTWRVPVFLA